MEGAIGSIPPDPADGTWPGTDACFGRYRVVDRLGSGGSGVVFRALDPESGEEVALKTLKLRDPRDLASLRREIHSLSRVRDDGIVRVFEQGVTDGIPWYSMELVEGSTIDALWSDRAAGGNARDHRQLPKLLPAISGLRKLCDTLAFLHGEGIVHRDLKPGNVVLRPDGAPVLVDFGFAGTFSVREARESLDVGGEMVGTLAYMSPEQARGEYVDARSDLYSLGCMLYEAVTGRPPFTGQAWEVLDQQLHSIPAPPSQWCNGVPEALDELVLRLLSKQPSDRLGYAIDVAARLDEILGVSSSGDPGRFSMYLYRSGFSGRQSQLAHVTGAIEELAGGEGGFVLVSGESGVGKTRFAMEAAREATRRGILVLTGQCVSLESARASVSASQGAPLHPLLPMLRYIGDHCRSDETGEAFHRLFGRRARTLAEYEPTLLSLAGIERYPDAAPMPSAAARDRLIADLRETLAAFASEVRTMVVLDDLQWADELTLDLLSSLPGEFFHDAPLLVLGCYRREERSPGLDRVKEVHGDVGVELDNLKLEDLSQLVSAMLAIRHPPQSLTKFLSTSSEGNPFFVSEYLRMVVEERLLVRSPQGTWEVAAADSARRASYDELPTPRSVQTLVRRRLDTISGTGRRVLQLAAVAGRESDASVLRTAGSFLEAELLESVGELFARHILEEAPGNRLRFTHDKLREVAYDEIDSGERVALHRRIAGAIEGHYGDEEDAPTWYPALALHWSSGGEDARAARYYSMAGERALRTGASGDACNFLGRALACDDRSPSKVVPLQRSRWQRQLAEAHYGSGNLAETIEQSTAALTLLGWQPPRTLAGWLVRIVGDLPELLRPKAAAGNIVDAAAHEAAMAAGYASQAYYLRMELVAGIGSSLQCVALARKSGSLATAAQAFAQLGNLIGVARVARVSRRCFEQARALRGVADPNVFGGSLYFEAISELGLGNCRRSRELGEESFALLQATGNLQEAETALAIVANALYFDGFFEEAARCCQELLESASARGNAHHAAWGRLMGGRSRVALGRFPEAIELLGEAREALRKIDDTLSLIMCEGSLARAFLYSGDLERARQVRDSLEGTIHGGGVVALAQCLDGIGGLAEVSLALSRIEPSASLAASTRRACSGLRRFATLFPLARPAALRASAEQLAAAGSSRRALKSWRTSLGVSSRLRLRYDQARAHQALAVHEETSSTRALHRTEAERLFTELGCDHHLNEMQGNGDRAP